MPIRTDLSPTQRTQVYMPIRIDFLQPDKVNETIAIHQKTTSKIHGNIARVKSR